jgi:hypothetical protein
MSFARCEEPEYYELGMLNGARFDPYANLAREHLEYWRAVTESSIQPNDRGRYDIACSLDRALQDVIQYSVEPLSCWPPSPFTVEKWRRLSFGALAVSELMGRLVKPEDQIMDARLEGGASLLWDLEITDNTLPKRHSVHMPAEVFSVLTGMEPPEDAWLRDDNFYLHCLSPAVMSGLLLGSLADASVTTDSAQLVSVRPFFATRPSC